MSPEQAQPATGAEFDQIYIWGRPADMYLAPRQIVKLMIMRSRLDDRHLLRNRVPASDATE
jgi:hypothetical protein